jgi:hypothetical protein
VATALLVVACSGSSGDASTSTPASSLGTTTITSPFTSSTIIVFPTTTTTTAPEPGSLEANRLLWEAQGIERYRMTIRVCGDFCVFYEVWVDGGTVVEIPHDREHPHHWGFGDVDWLFDVVESIPPRSAEVDYDPVRGFPTRITPTNFGEGSSMSIEDFQPTDEPLPEYEYPAEAHSQSDLRHQGRYIEAVVEGTVLERGDFTPAEVHPRGWIVEVDLDIIWYQRSGTPTLSLGITEVIDPLAWSWLQPHTLQHREGQRLILLLLASDNSTEGVPAWYASWALQRTDDGLDFLGFFAERYGFDADLPQLCTRGPSGEPRDADRELALLVRWAGEFDRRAPGEPARLVLRRACAADDLLPEW